MAAGQFRYSIPRCEAVFLCAAQKQNQLVFRVADLRWKMGVATTTAEKHQKATAGTALSGRTNLRPTQSARCMARSQLWKSRRARAARLARMTEEQRRRHENWHRERPVTTASDRAEQRRLRHDAKSARESFSSEPPSALSEDPEYRVLVARIAELKANLAAMEKEEIEKGVFG